MITYQITTDHLGPEHLHGFFVGWPNPPSPAVHWQLLQRSSYVVLARDHSTQAVVGFITAISDGVLSAYIPLLEVLPAWRGQGIGSELTRRMLAQVAHLYMVDVICDADVQPFYERLGMMPYTSMIARNYAQQAGAVTEDTPALSDQRPPLSGRSRATRTSQPDPLRRDFPAGCSQPALRALAAAGFTELAQLTAVSEDDLLRLHGMGPKALRALAAALAERGLHFAGPAR